MQDRFTAPSVPLGECRRQLIATIGELRVIASGCAHDAEIDVAAAGSMLSMQRDLFESTVSDVEQWADWVPAHNFDRAAADRLDGHIVEAIRRELGAHLSALGTLTTACNSDAPEHTPATVGDALSTLRGRLIDTLARFDSLPIEQASQ